MTAEELKDDIAWYHGAIAGAMNLYQLDDEYLQWLDRLMSCWPVGGCREQWMPVRARLRVSESGDYSPVGMHRLGGSSIP